MELKTLKEELGTIQVEMKELTDKEVMSNEDIELFDNKKARRDELKQLIASEERKQEVTVEASAKPWTGAKTVVAHKSNSKPSKRDYDNALKAWAFQQNGQSNLISTEMRACADKCEMNIHQSNLSVSMDWSDPITTSDYTSNYGLIQGIETARNSANQMRQACQIIRTEKGGTLPFLYVDDLSTDGAVKAKGTGFTNAGFTVQKLTVSDYTITSGVYPVAVQTIQDSAFDLSSYIGGLLVERLVRKENKLFATGGGTGATPDEPVGLATQVTPTLYYPSSDAVAWFDVFAALTGEVESPYADAPKSGFLMSRDTWTDVIRSVDSLGRPLFTPTVNSNGQKTVLGYPVWINPYLTDEVYFGDFSKLVIRDVGSVELVVMKELYRVDNNAIGFCAMERTDLLLTNPVALACAVGGGSSLVNCGAYAE